MGPVESVRVGGVKGGAFVVSGLGAVLFAFYLWYVSVHQYYLTGPVWLFPIGFMFVLVLSTGLLYGGYRLTKSEFSPETVWRVTLWCFAGLIGSLSLTFWPIFYQRVVGVAVEDPVFILLVSAEIGANAGLLVGIHDMRARERVLEIERARDGFRFLNRLLRHNVLNAVNVIQGYAETIARDTGDEGIVERTRTIRLHSSDIIDLITNARVLVQRIEEDASRTPVDLSRVADRSLESARSRYDDATVRGEYPPGVDVLADDLLSAVVDNLVSNAIEHNDHDAPEVSLSITTRGDEAVLRVADNGPGIPEEQRERLFDPGHHGDHGVGLYLVETLVSDYGGSVRIDDNEPRGTVVSVSLPLADGSAHPGPSADDSPMSTTSV